MKKTLSNTYLISNNFSGMSITQYALLVFFVRTDTSTSGIQRILHEKVTMLHATKGARESIFV